ncbi:hypothetical protein HMPREF9587_00067 [Cutibacterium acnes HL025PA1]|nr:hypothetical protein HMPREF9587_00067 [Cutibacterium acnes HL025PA1]
MKGLNTSMAAPKSSPRRPHHHWDRHRTYGLHLTARTEPKPI